MVSTGRTALRVFLLVGGLAFAAFGVVDGSNGDVIVGGVAAVLGGVGLALQYLGLEPGSDRSGGDE